MSVCTLATECDALLSRGRERRRVDEEERRLSPRGVEEGIRERRVRVAKERLHARRFFVRQIHADLQGHLGRRAASLTGQIEVSRRSSQGPLRACKTRWTGHYEQAHTGVRKDRHARLARCLVELAC